MLDYKNAEDRLQTRTSGLDWFIAGIAAIGLIVLIAQVTAFFLTK